MQASPTNSSFQRIIWRIQTLIFLFMTNIFNSLSFPNFLPAFSLLYQKYRIIQILLISKKCIIISEDVIIQEAYNTNKM